ncbi:unnamed protein product, partial [Ectocarpus sp. 8 AP-2014]
GATAVRAEATGRCVLWYKIGNIGDKNQQRVGGSMSYLRTRELYSVKRGTGVLRGFDTCIDGNSFTGCNVRTRPTRGENNSPNTTRVTDGGARPALNQQAHRAQKAQPRGGLISC